MVILQKIQHYSAPRIGLFFKYDEQLNQRARSIGAIWSRTYRCWYVDYSKENFRKIEQAFPEIEIINDPEEKVPPQRLVYKEPRQCVHSCRPERQRPSAASCCGT